MQPVEAMALISGRVSEELLLRNESLAAENAILRNKLGHRVPLTNVERTRLATLEGISAIVAPKTLLTWFRRLVAKKFYGSANRTPSLGRPKVSADIEELIVRLVREIHPGDITESLAHWPTLDTMSPTLP